MKMISMVAGRRAVLKTVLALSLGLVAAPLAAQSSDGASGTGEGVNVHGDWVIEVVNPDGTVQARHEFANALQNAGAMYLAARLSGASQPVANPLEIFLGGAGCNCLIRAPGAPDPGLGAAQGNDLLMSVNGGAVILRGSVPVQATGEVTQVGTYFVPGEGGFGVFTLKALDAGVAVIEGQTLVVTVTLSFS